MPDNSLPRLSQAQDAAVVAARAALGGRRPAVAAHDAWLASGLELLLPETVVMCIQRCASIDLLRARGIEVFCLAEHAPHEEVAGMATTDLFLHQETLRFCAGMGPLAVLAFKPGERLQAAVQAAGGLLLHPDATVARAFENKLNFVAVAARAGLPVPRWEVRPAGDAEPFAGLSLRLGFPLVVQGARGNAGQRTWLVSNDEKLSAARAAEAGRPLRVGGYITGTPLTATGAVTASGDVVQVEACRQVTGVEWLTPMPLGSCGNAWHDSGIEALVAPTRTVVERLGLSLAEAGFRGVFGVDLVAGPGGLAVIEVNPRMVASLPLATQLEVAAGRVPLLLHHLLALLGTELHSGGPVPATAVPGASQLILHLDNGAQRVARQTGIHLYRDGDWQWIRNGAWWSDLDDDGEVLLMLRDSDEPVTPGREYARVYTRHGLGETQAHLRALLTPGR
ncbi:MAG: ATP-grasp domain-containing protein [Candidatus Dormibacteria bacterium]